MRRWRKPSGPSRASCARHPRKPWLPWDITPSQFRALRVLSHHGVMRLSDLSEQLHIAARSTTEVVDALESRDLVERRTDPGDRRATLVELTEHGISILEAIRRPAEPRPNGSSAGSARQTALTSPAFSASSSTYPPAGVCPEFQSPVRSAIQGRQREGGSGWARLKC